MSADSSPAPRVVDPIDRARRVLDAAVVPVATLDGEGLVASLNPSFARLCGRGPGEVVGLHLMALCPGRDQADALGALVRILGGVSELEQVEVRVVGGDGRVRLLSVTLGAVHDVDGRVDRVLAIGGDLTQERREQRRRRRDSIDDTRAALHDADTGLPNERGLTLLLASAIRRSARTDAPFALLRCDVTNLDDIEQSQGAAVTRHVLELVTERLSQRLRSSDSVTRSGTATFSVVAEDLGDPQDAAGVAYRLLASIVEDVLVDNHAVAIDMVIGIAVGDESSSPARVAADAAGASDEARADGVGGFRIIDTRATSPA